MQREPITTTPREELALSLAIAFILVSPGPVVASIGDENIDKHDLVEILKGLKEKLCPTKQ